MKFPFLLALLASHLAAAEPIMLSPASIVAVSEPVFVTVGGTVYPARPVLNAPAENITGALVFAPLKTDPESNWKGKIVVLDRGGATFLEKVRAVQVAGGVAVIIANNVPGVANEASLGTDTTSRIPAVTVSLTDGAALKLAAGKLARVGTAAPVVQLPDPTGHAGETLVSDGVGYVFEKTVSWAASTLISEAEVGQAVTFAVTALGTAPFTYQWVKDGVDVPGRVSAVYSIAAATAEDAGTYICVVSNFVGFAPSGTCTLIIK